MAQQGSALLISLVLLALLTLTGITAIDSSTLEKKITGNFRDLQVTLHAGETALLEAEKFVESTTFDLFDFTVDCQKGLCFSGNNSDSIRLCRTFGDAPWQDELLWKYGSNRSRQLFSNKDLIAQYIVEFQCYLPADSDGPDPDLTNPNDWSKFFRITVKVESLLGGSNVMLQTTYKK